jgi:hypothetical protein
LRPVIDEQNIANRPEAECGKGQRKHPAAANGRFS